MNSDQIAYNNSTTTGLATQPMASTAAASALPHTTAHSYTVHNREAKYLEKEKAKEAKRALRQEKMADKNSVKAG
jgi:hypothetical protein